ncbi:hypothetical protein C9383_05265 [Pseudomonas palleroniana]|uniref:Uncharacterized protein n=1 Tax=Pseudomonas palleroniana TaxID=191390 RepID=A0A2T4G4G6_9PSED|nr:hypothetical protein F7R03_20155 [Pseudomonas palleroniana]PTC30555.1 hypothetical protein C9383_05265 [Pseudomonas palleroniana]
MLAKNVNDNACFLKGRDACEFFASKLAPTKKRWGQSVDESDKWDPIHTIPANFSQNPRTNLTRQELSGLIMATNRFFALSPSKNQPPVGIILHGIGMFVF